MDIGLLSSALGQGGGVAQGEDDGLLVEGGHVLDDLRGEHPGHSRGSDQAGGLDGLHDVAELLHLLVRVGKRGLYEQFTNCL